MSKRLMAKGVENCERCAVFTFANWEPEIIPNKKPLPPSLSGKVTPKITHGDHMNPVVISVACDRSSKHVRTKFK